MIEYAKAAQEDILCRITAVNRGPDAAPLHILPHIWYRNTWSWGYGRSRPQIRAVANHVSSAYTSDRHLGERWWYAAAADPQAEALPLLFTENETNSERLWGIPNETPFVKDGIHAAVVDGLWNRVNPAQTGSKAAAHYQSVVPPNESVSVWVRFANAPHVDPFGDFDGRFRAASAGSGCLLYGRSSHKLICGPDAASSARLLPASCGRNSFIITQSSCGWMAIPPAPNRRLCVKTAVIMIGPISTTATLSRCRTNGNIPGMPPGTWLSICCPWP